ncbi:MAG TPA: ATP-binding protein [Chloroflexia bacterium]|nr:ATP-binding protein [Chloroflexia bacterium]
MDNSKSREALLQEIEFLRKRINELEENQAKREKHLDEAYRNEAILRAILDNASYVIYVKNREGQFMLVNRPFEALVNLSKNEIIGKTAHDIFPADMAELYFSSDLKVLESRTPLEIEEQVLLEDGPHLFLSYKFPLLDATGEPYAMCDMSADVTEKKRTEEALQRSEEQFRQAQKMDAVGRLAGGVAHDFNNVLTAINGYCELLLETVPEEDEIHDDIGEIKRAAEQATMITRQLLILSRKEQLELKLVKLNDVVCEMFQMMKRLIGEDIEVLTSFESDLPSIYADSGRVQQVILNLVLNARDAMPNGGKLTIETNKVELEDDYTLDHLFVKPGHYVMLGVSDNGHGMDQETQSHIFEPFFTTKGQSKGTGLGLSTVYSIVKQFEGTIWVYSEPGVGTSFKIYLPVAQSEMEQPATSIRPSAAVHGTETVLVVEDEIIVLQLIQQVLKMYGYTVLEANTVEEAIRLSKQYSGQIDLLLSDMIMPRLSGPELREQVIKQRPAIKTLFMSGYTDLAIINQGLIQETSAYIEKPFSPAALARKVRSILDA